MGRIVPDNAPTLLEQGLVALARGEWAKAVTALEAAVASDGSDARAWESLGQACTWLTDTERAIAARQQAYASYRRRGNDADAARVALDLVWDYLEVRGEPALANGWFQRARRLLETLPTGAEHALLGVFEAYLAIDADPVAAAAHARDARAVARAVGTADVGCLAQALEGLALVTEGRVTEGMSLLDEAIAAVIGREISDPQWFYIICCCMIDACDRVRDFGRSLAWCGELRDFAERWGLQAFLTTCRIKYTGALLWRGDWAAYEAELEQALAELDAARPGALAGALVRLAELRRRQGQRRLAEALLQRAEAHPLADLVRIGLALDRNDAAAGAALADAVLQRTPDRARTERATALEFKVRAHAAAADVEAARAAADELVAIAERVDTPAFRAAAGFALGTVAAAAADHAAARRLFDDALRLFEASGARHEAVRCRIELAASLIACGEPRLAAQQAAAALAAAEEIGAGRDVRRARAVLERLSRDARRTGSASRRAPAGPLTRRQQEVLSLVAKGLSDRDVAERLFLSEHTVHRHMANILMRLGAPTRGAAVARAVRDGWIG